MIKVIINKTKNQILNFVDKLIIKHRQNNEKRKYKEKCRVEIYRNIELSAEQKKKIDVLYLENYGKKITYVWHQNFMAHSGKFDEKYFPELLYIPEFERYMNLWQEYVVAFGDKNVISILAKGIGIKTPRTILSVVKGMNRDENLAYKDKSEAFELLKDIGRVFIKPTVDSCSGRGCFIADFKDGIDTISKKSVLDIYNSLGTDFVVQNVVKCHDSISRIYDKSVNTFRIITYRWKDEILHMPVIMRIGQGGSFLDNAHAGGMFIAVDDDGTLHKTAMTEFNLQFASHPDTDFVFENAKIELLPEVIKAAKRMHVVMPQVGVVNWDFTLDQDGAPLLIEANLSGGSVWLPEMAHGCGAFGERTAEVLRWLKLMRSTKKSDRYKYAFGKTD